MLKGCKPSFWTRVLSFTTFLSAVSTWGWHSCVCKFLSHTSCWWVLCFTLNDVHAPHIPPLRSWTESPTHPLQLWVWRVRGTGANWWELEVWFQLPTGHSPEPWSTGETGKSFVTNKEHIAVLMCLQYSLYRAILFRLNAFTGLQEMIKSHL